MKPMFSFLFVVFILSIGIGPFKVVAEARICDTKLYDYCEAECFTDCPKKYGKKAQGLCNEASQCICRRQC
ncbi:hypothetical protein GLYMA_12G146000v4 [Glycine max]|uniref:Knottin scorpion toxin-like domain-containing protein n=2 Tax=Glycine subgen. Soja TaxID=1462606 RepID=K7LUY4_SOYBN|nr:hypothetical protein GYH30_033749 [Glycine max]KRH26017.1 hypothetical protein GLYMA_12G146000v4 [Glycine max]RZB75873.1 hypothetical protein D0Y65_034394 [Glycine soja]